MSKSPVLLIDLSALFRAAWHVVPSDGSPNIAYETTISSVNRCVNMTRDRFKLEENDKLRVAICCDGKGNWRKEISPEYKAHREAQPKSMYGMLDRVKDTLRKDAYLLWECDGYEADDIIGAATDALYSSTPSSPDEQEITQVVIASHDKDLCQLSAPNVTMLKTHTWQWSDMGDVVAKFGIKPYQIVDYLALMGDKADNIKGCDGCGDKTASDLVRRYETVEKLYAYIDNPANTATDPKWRTSNGKSPLAILDKLLQAKDSVLLAKKLVRLRYDAPIDIAELEAIRVPQKRVDSGVSFDESDFDFDEKEDDMSEIENRVFGPKKETTEEVKTFPICAACNGDPTSCGCKKTDERKCEFCGCSTNARVRACCGAGAAADGSQQPEAAKDVGPENPTTAQSPVAKLEVSAGLHSPQTFQDNPIEKRNQAIAQYIAPGDYERALEPRNTGGAVAMGELLFNSGLYQKFKNPQACTAALVRGREMGFGALASMDLFEVVKDKLCPKAHLIIHLGMSHPTVEYMYLSHSDDKYAEYTIRLKAWPKGVEQKHRYTIEEAIDAGLATLEKAPRDMTRDPKTKELAVDRRGQWDKRRPEMLRKTAGAQCVRIYVPGAGLGLTSSEEMGAENE